MGGKENLGSVLSLELPVLPGLHKQAGPCIHKLTSQASETRCSLEKGLSLLNVSLVFVYKKKEFMTGDCSSAATQVVNQVREDMKPGEVSDLPGEVLLQKEAKLCALVPSSL